MLLLAINSLLVDRSVFNGQFIFHMAKNTLPCVTHRFEMQQGSGLLGNFKVESIGWTKWLPLPFGIKRPSSPLFFCPPPYQSVVTPTPMRQKKKEGVPKLLL